MTFRFIYEPDYPRIIFACMMDARAGTPLANKSGAVQKEFIDEEISKVTKDVIFYRLETELGVMGGYFSLLTVNQGTTAGLYQFVLRPAFQGMTAEISEQITTFISGNDWKPDILI
jgi:hypothetical protein